VALGAGLSFVRVKLFGNHTVVLDVLEGAFIPTSLATEVSVRSSTIDQVLFRKDNSAVTVEEQGGFDG